MQVMEARMFRGFIRRTYAGFAVLAVVLSVLAGCATGGKETAVVEPAPPVSTEPSVARLEGGREGFVINEVPTMDEASRRDFVRAVVMLKNQDYTQAIELLEEVIERSPGVTAPYIDIAIAYERTGKPELAEEHLRTALELFPGHPGAKGV
jgi:tetratricopeptide (TPR) repeat protein